MKKQISIGQRVFHIQCPENELDLLMKSIDYLKDVFYQEKKNSPYIADINIFFIIAVKMASKILETPSREYIDHIEEMLSQYATINEDVEYLLKNVDVLSRTNQTYEKNSYNVAKIAYDKFSVSDKE